jgi:hypothetical protein
MVSLWVMASRPEASWPEALEVDCRPEGDAYACRVRIDQEGRITEHDVTVPQTDLARLAPGASDPTELVRASFEFLLEREPATSILRSFELSEIERYFPEYPREIAGRMGRPTGPT